MSRYSWCRYLIFVICISLICAIVLCEAVYLRIYRLKWHDPIAQFDAELGWSPIPNEHIEHKWGDITSNSFGFRSEEIDQKKNHVIILGDSVAWGFGVGDTETMPYYLNQKLKPLNYQVHNLAVAAYGIGQSSLFLQRHVDKFENLKYIILVVYTNNDFWETTRDIAWGKRKPLYVLKEGKLVLTNVPISKYNIRNMLSASKILESLSRKYGKVSSFLDLLAGRKILDKKDGEKAISLLLKRIHDIASEHQARLVVVTAPSKKDFTSKSDDFMWFQNFFHSKNHHYPRIDFYDTIASQPEDLDKIYKKGDPAHFSPYGNKLFAETLFKHIDM